MEAEGTWWKLKNAFRTLFQKNRPRPPRESLVPLMGDDESHTPKGSPIPEANKSARISVCNQSSPAGKAECNPSPLSSSEYGSTVNSCDTLAENDGASVALEDGEAELLDEEVLGCPRGDIDETELEEESEFDSAAEGDDQLEVLMRGELAEKQRITVVLKEDQLDRHEKKWVTNTTAQKRIEALIRERGYHIKKPIPRKLMDERVMENIRRRERVAVMILKEAAGCKDPTVSIDEIADEFLRKSRAYAKPSPRMETGIDPLRLPHVLGLVNEVWTSREAEENPRRLTDATRRKFVQDCLKEHNRLRQLHGSPPLVLCSKLCRDAQGWAERLVDTNAIEYSRRDGRGENILTSTTARGGITGESVTQVWYEQGRAFNFDVSDSADLAYAGSFSQVIWKSTKQLGVGLARTEEGKTIAVARYYPRGNVAGQFKANIAPLVRVDPFDLKKYTKTREEANLDVQTALIASEVCEGIAINYAIAVNAGSTGSFKVVRKHKKLFCFSGPRSKKAGKLNPSYNNGSITMPP